MSTFVLVHGAFRGAWAWEPVVRRLTAAGHRALAPSLTGMGDRAHLRPDDLGLATWVDDVAGLVESRDLRDVVLVGHSQGGLVATAAATRLAPRLAALVHLDAPLLTDGQRGVDGSGPLDEARLPPRDTWIDPSPLDPTGWPPEVHRWAETRLCATPFAPSLDPVHLDRAALSHVRELVVFCAGTPEGYPSTLARRRCDAEGRPYVLLDAPHDAPLTHPDEVTELLVHRSSEPPAGPAAG